MDPVNPLKHRLSKMFRSCKSRDDVSVVIERPVSTRQHYQLIELFSPKPCHPVFAMCGPKHSENTENLFPRPKVTDRYSLLCPPVSPAMPLDAWQGDGGERADPKGRERGRCSKTKKKSKGAMVDKKGRKRVKKKDKTTVWPINNNYYDWSTSDDDVESDDDETTLFSSKSLSSDSSDSFRRPRFRHSRRNKQVHDPTAVRDGFAIVKRSSDPHNDFRNSMVEMIVEKQIFGAKELDGLLQTFLSLNSCHHHRMIIEVFVEIWEALFSDLS